MARKTGRRSAKKSSTPKRGKTTRGKVVTRTTPKRSATRTAAKRANVHGAGTRAGTAAPRTATSSTSESDARLAHMNPPPRGAVQPPPGTKIPGVGAARGDEGA